MLTDNKLIVTDQGVRTEVVIRGERELAVRSWNISTLCCGGTMPEEG